MSLPQDAATRKKIPLFTGLLAYFPDACAAVAHCSYVGNEQHNPGEPLHWAREKSTDQEDCVLRHMVERSAFDKDGVRHRAKAAWRELAQLQLDIEADGGRIFNEPETTLPEQINYITYEAACTECGDIISGRLRSTRKRSTHETE